MTVAIDKALLLMIKAHEGQVDKAGNPYYLHPLAVAASFSPEKEPLLYAAALLHDVIEDSGNDASVILDIMNIGGHELFTLIDTLSRPKTTHYDVYIVGIKGNPDAVKIKIADLKHNLSKTVSLPEKLKIRYEKALAFLSGE